MVKMNSYLNNIVNFFFYLMWNITNILLYRHIIFIVSHGITKSNRQTPSTGPNRTLCRGWGSILIPFVNLDGFFTHYHSLLLTLQSLRHISLIGNYAVLVLVIFNRYIICLIQNAKIILAKHQLKALFYLNHFLLVCLINMISLN